MVEYKIVRQKLSKQSFDPDFVDYDASPAIRSVLSEVQAAQSSNVIVHAGYFPFVGCGPIISGWTFAVDITKGKQDLGRPRSPQHFVVNDLYDAVSSALGNLGLPNFGSDDRLCVHGQEIRNDSRFLTSVLARPCTKVETALINSLAETPTNIVRHYKVFQLVDWSGELILSVFVRFSKSANNLFVEVSYCLLAPLDETYHAVDALQPAFTWKDWVALCAASGTSALFFPFFLLNGIAIVSEVSRRDPVAAKQVHENELFNYGSWDSLRESVSSSNYRRYFQRLDKEMYFKIIEKRLFDSIVSFLDARDIDTSDLKETRTTILNSGIMISGAGSVSAGTLAVGGNATAVTQQGSPDSSKRGVRFPALFKAPAGANRES